jgi:hypothetical protein
MNVALPLRDFLKARVFRTFMVTWKKFLKLNRGDQRLALEAAAIMIATRIGLRIAGYRRWEHLLARFSSGIGHQNRDVSGLARMTASVSRNLFFRPTCLEGSLAFWWMLRRRGNDAKVHIGGRKEGAKFEAHAWVECDGIELSDMGAVEFSRFAGFDRSGVVAARSGR